jgi:hypothetical protein
VRKQRRFVGNRCAGNGIHIVPTQPGQGSGGLDMENTLPG